MRFGNRSLAALGLLGIGGSAGCVGATGDDVGAAAMGLTDQEQMMEDAITCTPLTMAAAVEANKVIFDECDSGNYSSSDQSAFCETIHNQDVLDVLDQAQAQLATIENQLDQGSYAANDRANIIADLESLLDIDLTAISNVP